MYSALKRRYERAPLAIKRCIGLLPYALLAGGVYRRTLRMCRASEVMTRSEVLSHQEGMLGRLLWHAVRHVPFYRRYTAPVMRFAPYDALREFPLLEKKDVRANFEELSASLPWGARCHESSTGGSSGDHLTFLEDDATYAREMAFMHSQWKRVGYTPTCRKATFRGVAFREITDTCFWEENPIHNELLFSPFHMSERNLELYIQKLIEYQPQYLHGYPSAIDILAAYVLHHEKTLQLPPVDGVLLGSEDCSVEQRARIENAFTTRVYTWYGHSERTVLGGECEKTRCYHAFPGYGILEILNKDGESCHVGEQGEIVGTGFLNRSMPLIRYRTDDYATRESYECECGRSWDRFSAVVSRRMYEGFVFGRNGSKISATALNIHSDCFRNVLRYQYYQTVVGQLVIRVIPMAQYSSVDEARIVAEHEMKLQGEMEIVVRKIDDIPLTKSGKQQRLVCDVK